jgi:hypothetical protein
VAAAATGSEGGNGSSRRSKAGNEVQNMIELQKASEGGNPLLQLLIYCCNHRSKHFEDVGCEMNLWHSSNFSILVCLILMLYFS